MFVTYKRFAVLLRRLSDITQNSCLFFVFVYVKGSAPSRTGTIPSDYIQLLERPRSSSAPNGRHFNPGTSAVIPPPLTRSQSGNSIIQSTGGNSVPTDPRNSPGHQQQQSPVSTNANETSTPSGITLNTTVQIIQVNFQSNSILLSKKNIKILNFIILSPYESFQGLWIKQIPLSVIRLRIPSGRRWTSWLFTSVTKDL